MTDEEKIKVLKEALEFYAHGKSWESNFYGGTSKIQHDQGKRATEALKAVK